MLEFTGIEAFQTGNNTRKIIKIIVYNNGIIA